MPSSILFVHQGYELYGSDRTLIQSVQATASRWPEAKITVLLPREGDLQKALLSIVDDVRIVDLAVLRKSSLKDLKLRDVISFIRRMLEAKRMMRSYDVTYINTVVIMDYIIAAGLLRRPSIVHVHEIPTGLTAVCFSALLMFSRAFLIFNSHATQKSFRLPFWQGKAVVWNGIAPPQELLSKASHSKLNLLLIGRFNSWKGQAVLLHAVAQLPSELRNRLSVRLVGSVFGSQMHFADELERIVGENGISQIVRMFPFTPNPYPHYNWADVVVVPSIKPEPFGLVAIEAMAAGCSVIAANHGGLAEIVVDDETGSLVVPGSIDSLTTAIVRYIEDPVRAVAEGNAGRARFEGIFEESNYMLKIMKIITDLTENAKIA